MVHGSTHTGAALDATPDGREGWFPYAVRNGLATFVVDQPGRGPLRLRPVGDPRGQAHGQHEPDPEHRPDHRQRRVDHLVRPHHPSGHEHPRRHDDPPRRSGRPRSAGGLRQPRRRTATIRRPIPSRRCRTRSTRTSPPAKARSVRRRTRRTTLPRARVLQAAGAERRGHAARLRVPDLQSDRPSGRPTPGARSRWPT